MRKTLEQFVEDARKVHRDKYCYDHVVYTTNSTKVTILCPEHGPFSQLPVRHTSGKMEELYNATIDREQHTRSLGYNLIVIWERDFVAT